MIEILKTILGAFDKDDFQGNFQGNFIVIFIVILIVISFKLKKITDYYTEQKKSKINAINEALKCKHVTGLTKNHLEEALVTEHFRISTGLSLEKDFREALILAHKKTSGEISFKSFKKALSYLQYTARELYIKISWRDRFAFFLLCSMSIFLLIYSFLGAIVVSLYSDEFTSRQITKIAISCCVYFITAIFFFGQTLPYFSARKIEKALNKHRINILDENDYSI